MPNDKKPQLALAGLSGAIGLLAELNKAAKEITTFVGTWLDVPPQILSALLFIPAIFLLVSHLRARAGQRSRLVNAEILDRRIQRPDQLYGRAKDLEALLSLVATAPMLHVSGESGVGKSTLLTAGLLPNLQERHDLLAVYIDSYGREDWEASPRLAVTKAVWRCLSPEQLEALKLPLTPDHAILNEALRGIREKLLRTPILVFDQFESYLVANRSRLLSPRRRTWLSWSELTQRNRFWADLAILMEHHIIHVVISVRVTDQDGLRPFTPQHTEAIPIDRVSKGVVIDTLREITAAGLASNPGTGWSALSDRLVTDLSADGEVLPVRMTVALQGLVSLPHLTVRDYVRLGGLEGLEAEFILNRSKAAARETHHKFEDVLHLLTTFQSELDVPAPISTVDLLKRSHFRNQNELSQVLRYLDTHNIVRRRLNPDSDGEHWSLYHHYLSRAVAEAEERVEKWAVALRSRERSYTESGRNPWKRWRTLLSPGAQVLFLYQQVRGRLRSRSHSPIGSSVFYDGFHTAHSWPAGSCRRTLDTGFRLLTRSVPVSIISACRCSDRFIRSSRSPVRSKRSCRPCTKSSRHDETMMGGCLPRAPERPSMITGCIHRSSPSNLAAAVSPDHRCTAS
jgi:hypothetical protein